MALGQAMILPSQPTFVSVELSPTYNILNTIAIILSVANGADTNPGLDDWAVRVAGQVPLSPVHRRILFWACSVEGLSNLVETEAAFFDFSAYLEQLDAKPARHIIDTMIYWQYNSAHARVFLDAEPLPPPDISRLFSDLEYFTHYLKSYYDKGLPSHLEIEEIHAYLNRPDDLKEMLLTGLKTLWYDYIKAEWQRILPELEECVIAFHHINLADMSIPDAMRVITGRNLTTHFNTHELSKFDLIRFIPSKHNGPYITWFGNERELNVIFGARIPKGVLGHASPLDNAELLHRLKAMADETRLEILMALKKHGELGTQELLEMFDLNKSAASRHLRNLHASGLIIERRDSDNKTKFYSLDKDNINAAGSTISALLD